MSGGNMWGAIGRNVPKDKYQMRMMRPDWRGIYVPRAIAAAKGSCQMCIQPTTVFEIHHLTYERLGRERDEDLIAVCRECHPKADRLRRVAVTRDRRAREAKADDALDQARMMGWCRKRFGDDSRNWPEDYVEQFWAWEDRCDQRGDNPPFYDCSPPTI